VETFLDSHSRGDTFPFVRVHIFHVNENLERFPHVGNILSIKACFWGSRNFCNRWTLVTCRVDSNIEHPKAWGSAWVIYRLMKFQRKINWSVQNKLVNKILSTRHVTTVHLLQKFLDPQKHALIDNILPTCGNLSRFSFTWKMCTRTKGNVSPL
jgi:hypothetical protein